MNGGGIRSQLPTCGYQPTDHALKRAQYASDHVSITTCAGYASGAPYNIVLGDIFTLLPFGNILNTRTVTGAQLWAALENGVSQINSTSGAGSDGRFPQISGFKFTFHYGNASGSRVTAVQLTDGTPIPNSTTATYTLVLPNFVNRGGDGYAVFNDGLGATQELDAIVMKEYLKAAGPNFDPASKPLDRITKLP
jgi:5'-nucleotidase